MLLTDLFALIQKTLGTQGFELSKHFQSSAQESFFTMEDDIVVRNITFLNEQYPRIYGVCLKVAKTYHRNSSGHDTSYYLSISLWDRSSGRTLKHIKLMSSQTEGTLTRKILAFVEEYKAIREAWHLNNLIDGYMKK